MQSDSGEEVIITETWRYKKELLLILLMVCVGVGVAVYFFITVREPDIPVVVSTQQQEESATASSTATSVFRLMLVPDATSSIVLSLPVQTDVVKKADRAAYDNARTILESQKDESDVPVIDGPYALEVDLVSAMRELQLSDSATMLYRVQDELLALTQYFNTMLQQQSPVTRGVADTIEPPYEAAMVTTAPSSHVVLAYFMGDILKKSTLVKSDEVDKAVSDLITRGVGQGLYSMSDIEVSKSLYSQYKKLVIAAYPELSNSF